MAGTEGAKRLAALLPRFQRGLTSEELLLVATVANEPAANSALNSALADPANLRLLYDNRAACRSTPRSRRCSPTQSAHG